MRFPPCLLAWLVAVFATAAGATTFIPMPIEELASSSQAVVIGTVQQLTSVRSRSGEIHTLVQLQLDDVIKGALADPVITLNEDGGVVGGDREVVFGTPRFQISERVLLFLTVRPDGSLRTNHLSLGKFRIDVNPSGTAQARQDVAADATVLGAEGALEAPLEDLVAAVQRVAGPADAVQTFSTLPVEATDPSLPRETTAEFQVGPSGRFFEADEGTPIDFLIDKRGDSTLGLATSRAALDQAFATWTNVASASIILEDGGLTGDLSSPCPGPNMILFDDPEGAIPDPVNCHGVLALTGLGGPCSSSFETKVFNGRSFERALRGKVTLANGWNGCAVWNACNFAELATHELGHAIGLAHSSDNAGETDPLLLDATMYFMAHFDGRCAAVRTDDINGVSFLYPTAQPPTITTTDTDPQFAGRAGHPYRFTLSATGGSGSFTWSLESGGFQGLTLSADGVLSGTPAFGGSGFFQIKATDSNGDSHTKVLTIQVSGPTPTRTRTPTVTPTATRTPTSSRTPTVTVTPTATSTATATDTPIATSTATYSPTSTPTDTETPTATPTTTATPSATLRVTLTPTPACPGDCNGSGEVSVPEIITLVNALLGTVDPASCAAGDRNHDGQITVNEVVAAVTAALGGCQ